MSFKVKWLVLSSNYGVNKVNYFTLVTTVMFGKPCRPSWRDKALRGSEAEEFAY